MCVWDCHSGELTIMDAPPYLIQIDFHKSVVLCALIWYKNIRVLLCQRCYVCMARRGRAVGGKVRGELERGKRLEDVERERWNWNWREEKIAH